MRLGPPEPHSATIATRRHPVNRPVSGVPLPVSLAPLGFPGCQAWIAPAAGAALAYSGSASWAVPIPMNAFVLGVDLYFQGGVLVPGWNPGGFVFTNAGHAVVGNL